MKNETYRVGEHKQYGFKIEVFVDPECVCDNDELFAFNIKDQAGDVVDHGDGYFSLESVSDEINRWIAEIHSERMRKYAISIFRTRHSEYTSTTPIGLVSQRHDRRCGIKWAVKEARSAENILQGARELNEVGKKAAKMRILHNKQELLIGDEQSIKMIFNNLTGRNFTNIKEHISYLKNMSNDFFNGLEINTDSLELDTRPEQPPRKHIKIVNNARRDISLQRHHLMDYAKTGGIHKNIADLFKLDRIETETQITVIVKN